MKKILIFFITLNTFMLSTTPSSAQELAIITGVVRTYAIILGSNLIDLTPNRQTIHKNYYKTIDQFYNIKIRNKNLNQQVRSQKKFPRLDTKVR